MNNLIRLDCASKRRVCTLFAVWSGWWCPNGPNPPWFLSLSKIHQTGRKISSQEILQRNHCPGSSGLRIPFGPSKNGSGQGRPASRLSAPAHFLANAFGISANSAAAPSDECHSPTHRKASHLFFLRGKGVGACCPRAMYVAFVKKKRTS